MTALWGSRKKAKLALRKTLPAPPKQDHTNNPTSLSIVPLANGQERTNPSPGGSGAGSPQTHASKRSITRFSSWMHHKDFLTFSFSEFD